MTSRTVLAATLGLSALVFGALAWGASHGNVAHALTNCDTGSAELSQVEKEAIWEINRLRGEQGLPPYWVSPALNRAAAWKSEDSSNIPPYLQGTPPNLQPIPFKGHNDSTGSTPGRSAYQRAIDCGYSSGSAENIAYGTSDPITIVDMWMNSPAGHRQALLGSYAVIGVGASGASWVANFGTSQDAGAYFLEPPSSSPPPPPPPPPPSPSPSPEPTAAPAVVSEVPTPAPVVPRVRVPMLARQ